MAENRKSVFCYFKGKGYGKSRESYSSPDFVLKGKCRSSGDSFLRASKPWKVIREIDRAQLLHKENQLHLLDMKEMNI